MSNPEMLTIDKAVETILEELEITDNLVNITIDISNSNTETLMEKIKQQEETIAKLQGIIQEQKDYPLFRIDYQKEKLKLENEELKKQISNLQSQIEENTSSKMIELSTENERLKQELKINDLALRIAVKECGKITVVQAYQLAKKAIEDVNNGN